METKKKYDVKNTKEMLDLVLGGVSVVVLAKADGKIDLNDAVLLIGLFPKVKPALDDMKMIPKELDDLDTVEAAELITHVMSRLAITDVHARMVIDKSLRFVIATYDLISEITKK